MSTPPMIRLIVDQLQELLANAPESFFVGGCVRDLLLGRPLHDLDLVVAGDAVALARAVARTFHAAFVLLDEQNGIARVVLRGPEETTGNTIDFARMRGPDLAADLAARDLTINAMAMAPAAFGRALRGEDAAPEVIDPLGGRRDLRAGRLAAPSQQSFLDDPLRTMRAVRFAGELGFAIAPRTATWIRRAAGLLADVSWERIRDELARLLACPHAAPYLPLLADLELLPRVLPEAAERTAAQQSHRWETVCCLEWILACLNRSCSPGQAEAEAPPPPAAPAAYWRPAALQAHPDLPLDLPYSIQLRRHLDRRLAERPRRVLLKLAAMLHPDAPGPAAPVEEAARRLRFSAREALALAQAAAFSAWATAEATRRYVYRLHRQAGDGAVDILLLSLADDLAQAGPRLDLSWWRRRVSRASWILTLRQEEPQVLDPPRLIDGHELLHILGLQPGPLVGDLLEGIREAQAAGEIRSREEAVSWARAQLE